MKKMQLVGLIMPCRLCGKSKDSADLDWVVMTNKDLYIKMLIHYGTHIPNVCNDCRKEFNLPIYKLPKKVSISVLQDTKKVLKFLMKQHNYKSYDDLLKVLVHGSKFGEAYLDEYIRKYNLNKDWLNEESKNELNDSI